MIRSKDTRLRVTFLLPDLRGGGAERVAVNLANHFVQSGYAVDVVLLSATGEFMEDLRPEINVVDLHVKRQRSALVPLVRYLRLTSPDVLLACMWPLTIIAILARSLARGRTRVIVAEHTTWSRSELLGRWPYGWQIRTSMHHLFPKADAVVVVSRGAADDLASFARLERSSITVIYNPVVGAEQSTTVAVLKPDDWWAGPYKRVLAVGTLKAIKDYSTLLKAFARLLKQVDARLLILGEGECRLMWGAFPVFVT